MSETDNQAPMDGSPEQASAQPVPATDQQEAAAIADGASGEQVSAASLNQNANAGTSESVLDPEKLGILNDVFIELTIEIGRAQIKIRDLLNLVKGSIVELDKLAGDPVGVYANGKLIATGNIICANGKYCVRLLSINQS